MKVFLDTNVIFDMVCDRFNGIKLKLQLKQNKIECVTSTWAVIELTNLLKERQFAEDEFLANKTELDKILKMRSEKELTEKQLEKIKLKLDSFLSDYDYIQIQDFLAEHWQGLKVALESSNIPSNDIIHFITALANQCTHFVTRDSFLKKTIESFCQKNGLQISVLSPDDLINEINLVKQAEQDLTMKNIAEILTFSDANRGQGSMKAKILMTILADLECSFCQQFFTMTFPKIKKEYIDTGKIRFSFVHFPLAIYRYSRIAAIAAEAAGEQGKFWEYIQLTYQNQQEWKENPAKLTEYAQLLGLNMEQFYLFFNNPIHNEKIEKTVQELNKVGLQGTPTFLINNSTIVGAQPFEVFAQVMENELAQKTQN